MGRAKSMTTHRLLSNFLVCVPESEKAAYAETVGEYRVVGHPDSMKGLPRKNNWILDHLMDDEAVVLLDDDIDRVVRCFVEQGADEVDTDSPVVIEEIIRQGYEMAEDMGAFLFGWSPDPQNIVYFHGMEPFKLTGWVCGAAKGIRKGSSLRYDERLTAKEDYDISLLNAYVHRFCLKNMRYCFAAHGTFVSEGGLSKSRNSMTEKADIELLKRKWGQAIQPKGHSPMRKRDYIGTEKINIVLPF